MDVRPTAKGVVDRLKRHDGTLAAAGLAFYGMVALIPALIVVVGLYGMVASRSDVTRQVDSLTGTLPDTTAHFLEAQLQEVVATTPATLGLSMTLALLAALWSVSSAIQALMRVVNAAHDLNEGRSLVRVRITALVLGTLLALAACVLLGTIVLLPRVLPDGIGGLLASWLRWPILFLFTVVVLSLVYRLAPAVSRSNTRAASAGGLFAATAILGGTILFGVYVDRFSRIQETYGALTSIIVLMLWLYVAALAVVVGAELDAELDESVGGSRLGSPS